MTKSGLFSYFVPNNFPFCLLIHDQVLCVWSQTSVVYSKTKGLQFLYNFFTDFIHNLFQWHQNGKKKKKLKYLPCCSYLRHFWRKYCRLSFLPLCFTFPSCALPFNIFSSLLYPCSQSREVKVSHILFSECCSFAWPLPLLITVMSVFSNYDQPFLFFQSNSYFTEFQIYKTCVILAKT